jgi:hypothetical protein
MRALKRWPGWHLTSRLTRWRIRWPPPAPHEASLDIAERLAAADPANTQLQRDLSLVRQRIGNLPDAPE